MRQEAPDAGLPKPGDALHEVNPFVYRPVGVIVYTLLWSSFSQHVTKQRRMSGLLVGHKLNQRLYLRAQPGGLEFFVTKAGKAIVEEVQFDVFLIYT